MTDVLHYTAFATDPAGGNPAGVVLDASGLNHAAMLAIAAGLGYSETAFLTPPPDGLTEPGRAFTLRYFSPKAEVSFCGHATVATAVALAERMGPGGLTFATKSGTVPVEVAEVDGVLHATLTSVEPYLEEASDTDVRDVRAHVRRMLSEALAGRVHGFDADDVDLMVSEIATNAVRYSHSGRPGGALRVSVLVSSKRIRSRFRTTAGRRRCR